MGTRDRKLPYKTVLYIPHAKMLPEYRTKLIDAAGGLSDHLVHGYWKNDEGQVVGEFTHELTVYYGPENWLVAVAVAEVVSELLMRGESEVLVEHSQPDNAMIVS